MKLYSSKINDDVRTLEKSLNKKVEVLKDLASDLIAILDLKLNKAEKKSLDDKFKEFNNVLIEIKQMCLDDSMAEIEKVELNFKDKLMSSISKSINIENANSKKIIVELLSK